MSINEQHICLLSIYSKFANNAVAAKTKSIIVFHNQHETFFVVMRRVPVLGIKYPGVFIGTRIGIGAFLSRVPIPKFDKITVQELMMKLARHKKIKESYFVFCNLSFTNLYDAISQQYRGNHHGIRVCVLQSYNL